jgi:hypothetical protein
MQFKQQVQIFQEIRKFAHTRINLSPVYKEIIQELDVISLYINTNKLTIQIFSQSPPLSQGIYNFLSSNQSLQQFYQATISEFPKISSASATNLLPTLILKSNPASGQQETKYELTPNQQILIGRDYQRLSQDVGGQNAQLLTLSGYSKISSVHAKIQDVNNPSSNSLQWQICDGYAHPLGYRNSTNGTYVNGDRITGCRTLNPGDRITLAYPSPHEKGVEFIFHCPPSSPSSKNQDLKKLIQGNIIFLVVTYQQLLTADEHLLLDLINQTQISGFVLIVDTSGANEQAIQKIDAELANLHNVLTVKYPGISDKYLLMKLILYPFYQENPPTSLHPAIQQQFERLYSILMNLTQNKDEMIFTRFTSRLNAQICRIEEFINKQERILKEDAQKIEASLQNQSIDDWKERVRKAFTRVREEKGEFFAVSSNDVRRSSTDFIAPFISGGFLQKLKLFIDQLNPVVTNEDKKIYIQLRSDMNLNTHEAIIHVCKSELTYWVNHEWNRISTGLKYLNENSYTTLNCLPSLKLKNSFNQTTLQVDIHSSLQISFTEIQNSTSFQDPKYRNDDSSKLFMLGGQLTIATAMLNPMVLLQGMNTLINLVGSTLSRDQLKTFNVDQTVDSLKQNLFNFYQGIAKYMLDKVIQDINTALAAEDKHFRKALEATDEQFNTYFNELRKILEDYRVRYNSLTQERTLLEQIKQLQSAGKPSP